MEFRRHLFFSHCIWLPLLILTAFTSCKSTAPSWSQPLPQPQHTPHSPQTPDHSLNADGQPPPLPTPHHPISIQTYIWLIVSCFLLRPPPKFWMWLFLEYRTVNADVADVVSSFFYSYYLWSRRLWHQHTPYKNNNGHGGNMKAFFPIPSLRENDDKNNE